MATSYTANQLIALNLARARKAAGWTQEETAERLEPFLGTRWSVPSISAIERSVTGTRIKQFSADEIVAVARAFSLPIGCFFLPPANEPAARFDAPDNPAGHDFHLLVEVLLGSEDGRRELEGELLSWAAAHGSDENIVEITNSIREDRNLRFVARLYEAFGDLGEARYVLERLAVALELLAPDVRENRHHEEVIDQRYTDAPNDTSHHQPGPEEKLRQDLERKPQGETA